MLTFEKRKWWYFGKNSHNHIEVGVYYFPLIGFSMRFGESLTFTLRCILNFYISFDFRWISSLIYKYKLDHRELEIQIGFTDGITFSISLFADSMSWSKGDYKWYCNISDKLKGKYTVTKKIIEERNVLIPMPEKSYLAHIVLADWTWTYPRWFKTKVRRAEIEMSIEGIPFAGKGTTSYNCGDDAVHSMTTGNVNDIPDAVGKLVSSVLHNRVKNGGWGDWEFKR